METEERIGLEVKQQPKGLGFRLTEDDIEILRLIREHRFLRREQISALTDRHPAAIHRRLSKLEAASYVSPLRRPQQKFIYRMRQAGVVALIARGLAPSELTARRSRDHELKPLFLEHEMMLVDLHVAMNLASRSGNTRLTAWEEGKGTHHAVNVTDEYGSHRLPLRPDAFFKLVDARWPPDRNTAHFALEADRSTTSHIRFRDKLRAYWQYIDQGLPQRKVEVKRFRVLTVALTAERARNLCALCADVVPVGAQKYFLFTSIGNCSAGHPVGVFGSVCMSPRDERLQGLMPTPNELQKEGRML